MMRSSPAFASSVAMRSVFVRTTPVRRPLVVIATDLSRAEVRLSQVLDGGDEVGESFFEKRLAAGDVEFAQVRDERVR